MEPYSGDSWLDLDKKHRKCKYWGLFYIQTTYVASTGSRLMIGKHFGIRVTTLGGSSGPDRFVHGSPAI